MFSDYFYYQIFTLPRVRNFLDGLTLDLYKVTVGDVKCEDVSVTDNSISCLPPTREPKQLHPRVKVRYWCTCKLHRDNLFETNYGFCLYFLF